MSEEDPDWDSFETYKGHDEPPRYPSWLAKIFHYFMIGLIFAVVFSIGAFIAFFLPYGYGGRGSRRYAQIETEDQIWTRCIIGGAVTVIILIFIRYRRNDDTM